MTRVVVVTNIPTPYRVPVYERLGEHVDLHVVYLAEREPDRDWVLPPTGVRSTVLRSRTLRIGARYVHVTTGTGRLLGRLRPDVVVTTGFNPPHLAAVAWCGLHRVPHVAQTDGTIESERGLTVLHQLVRRVVARRTAAFVAASRSGRDLVVRWGAPVDRVSIAPLAADVGRFAGLDRAAHPDVDVLFVGRLAPVKNPLLVLDAAQDAARALERPLRVAILGDGPLRDRVAERARRAGPLLDVVQPGFVQQHDLPAWFARARAFAFPTAWDPWGLVVNEAASAGVPQVVSPHAGSVRELIEDGVSGLVRDLHAPTWAAALVQLLGEPVLAGRIAAEARRRASAYTFDAAAEGMREAIGRAVDQASARADS